MVDLSGVTPAARPIVVAAAAVYRRHSGRDFIGLLLHGSALKGGFIPGCSDVDFQLYLDQAAFADAGQLPLKQCLAIQRDLARIDPTPFRYIQCAALSSELPPAFLPPVAGTYLLLAGRLPVAEATEEQIAQAAHHALQTLVPVPPFVVGNLLEHGAGRLAAAIRLLCTWVWPTLYHVLVLRQASGAVWRLAKGEAIALLTSDGELGSAPRAFYAAVRAYYPAETSLDAALAVIEQGVRVLRTANTWYAGTYPQA